MVPHLGFLFFLLLDRLGKKGHIAGPWPGPGLPYWLRGHSNWTPASGVQFFEEEGGPGGRTRGRRICSVVELHVRWLFFMLVFKCVCVCVCVCVTTICLFCLSGWGA